MVKVVAMVAQEHRQHKTPHSVQRPSAYLEDKLVYTDGNGADHNIVQLLVMRFTLSGANINDFPFEV